MDRTRRQLLSGVSLIGAGVLVAGCRQTQTGSSGATNQKEKSEDEAEHDLAAVSATELEPTNHPAA